jgi:NADH dehydrogenase
LPKRVFITGGSGFVGAAVIDELLARGHVVRALVNRREIATRERLTPIRGDLSDVPALERGLVRCDAVIHLVGIIFEHPGRGMTFERIHVDGTRVVIDAARRAGVRRYVHMSALGTRPDAVSRYHQTKYEAEQQVIQSGLEWTIFRPSMIHGPRGDFTQMQARWARNQAAPYFFMPYFGAGVVGEGGAGRLQPVYVNDVARAFADALERPQTIGQTYPLAGSERLIWPQMHRIVSRAIVRTARWTVPIPAWYARLVAAIAPPALLPFNRDQVIMSQEDNTADMARFEADFGWRPGGFSEQIKEYAGQLSPRSGGRQ